MWVFGCGERGGGWEWGGGRDARMWSHSVCVCGTVNVCVRGDGVAESVEAELRFSPAPCWCDAASDEREREKIWVTDEWFGS